MKKYPLDLTVIIVTHNHEAFILPCLESIQKNRGDLDLEILVVDNASKDRTPEILKRYSPNNSLLRVIPLFTNLGLSRAVNLAFQESHGLYIAVCNPDVICQERSIDRLFHYMETHSDLGLLFPKFLNPDGTLQYSCRRFYSLASIIMRRTPLGTIFPDNFILADHLMQNCDLSQIREVDWAIGAFFLVRRQALPGQALFDPRFFLYFEDVDLAYSVRKRGFKVVYFPRAEMIHHNLRESARPFNWAQYYHLYSAIQFFIKNRELIHLW